MSAAASVRVPEHRADVAGSVRVTIDECTDVMAGEMRHADFFAVAFEDLTESVREYSRYLTDAELARCFRAAMRRTA